MVKIHQSKSSRRSLRHKGTLTPKFVVTLHTAATLFLGLCSAVLLVSYGYFFLSLRGSTEGGNDFQAGDVVDARNLRHGGTSSEQPLGGRGLGVGISGGGDATRRQPPPRATVGYAVSLTGCGSDPLSDGGAVLQHSIRLNSYETPTSHSKYAFKMYAIVHPTALECSSQLKDLGYEILVRDTPVQVKDIEGEFLRTKVEKNGCCGEKEFIKLHAYSLIQHPIVVHLDLDTLVLQPLDELFDNMLDGPKGGGSNLPIMFNAAPPEKIDAYFTRDYNMANKNMKHVGVQGGFLVLRPSQSTYEEFVGIIRKGDFRQGSGWGGLGFGPFYGSMTFQGIVPYYYDALHPNTAVELSRCLYNQMCDNPRDKPTKNDIVSGDCRDGQEDCEDCRSRDISEVKTAHFTLCQKPWWCLPHGADRIQDRLCRKLHAEWFRMREDLETRLWGRQQGREEGTFQPEQFRGYCKRQGEKGYIPINVPTVAKGV